MSDPNAGYMGETTGLCPGDTLVPPAPTQRRQFS